MKFLKSVIFLFISGVLTPVFPGFVVHLNDDIEEYRLGYYMDILEDTSKTMTLEHVSSDQAKGLFQPSEKPIPSYGFSDSSFWIRFTVYNHHKYTKEYFLEYSNPLTDQIELYKKNESGKYIVQNAGDFLPHSKRDINFHNFIFRLPVYAGMNTFYMRINTTSSANFNLTLFTHTSILEMMNTEKIWLGFYYGLMTVMLLFNFFVFFSLKDLNYLRYSIFIATYILFQFTLNGLSFQYLWPNSIWWENTSPAVLMGGISLTGLIFTRYFLRTYLITPFLDKVLLGLSFPILLSLILSLFSYHIGIKMGTFIGTLLLVTMLISGFACLRKGDRAARYYIIAWFLFLVGSILKSFQTNGVIETNLITIWGQQIGSAVDVTLLSLAMMDRYNLMKIENDTTQKNLYRIQKEYSESLEKTVEERTMEITQQRNKLESRNKIMEYELSLARSIQEKLVPVEIRAENIAALYKPMVMVGGDFFDIIPFKNTSKTGIFISDVAGHGIQAAFITSMVKTIILQSEDKIEDPALLLSHINEFFTSQQIQGFITIYYGIFDAETNILTFANAGHPAPFILNDTISEIKAYRTIPAGIMDNEKLMGIDRPFLNKTRKIPSGSKVVFYTDGLTECTPVYDARINFETHSLKKVLMEHKDTPCHVFINYLYNDLVKFREDDTFMDDICVVCLDVP